MKKKLTLPKLKAKLQKVFNKYNHILIVDIA